MRPIKQLLLISSSSQMQLKVSRGDPKVKLAAGRPAQPRRETRSRPGASIIIEAVDLRKGTIITVTAIIITVIREAAADMRRADIIEQQERERTLRDMGIEAGAEEVITSSIPQRTILITTNIPIIEETQIVGFLLKIDIILRKAEAGTEVTMVAVVVSKGTSKTGSKRGREVEYIYLLRSC